MSSSKCPPKVLWAQTQSNVLITICLEDCKDPTIKVEEKKLFFSGTGGKNATEHEVTMDLFEKVVPDQTTKHFLDRVIEIRLQKEDANTDFWPRLLQVKTRQHWLGIDFLRWQDESDEEEEGLQGGLGDMDWDKKLTPDMMQKLAGNRPDLADLDDEGGDSGAKERSPKMTEESMRKMMGSGPYLNDLEDEDDDEDEGDIPGLMY